MLQKIWHEGAFDDRELVDSEGRQIAVRFPGHWNRLDGPDFKGAVLYIDGVYADSEHIDDMCDCTVAMLLKRG